MSRFATPLFLTGVTVLVMLFNCRPDAVITFPFLDAFVLDPTAQGYLTVCLLWLSVGASLLWSAAELVVSEVRLRRAVTRGPRGSE